MSHTWKIVTRRQVLHLHRVEPISRKIARAIARQVLRGDPIIHILPED